MGKPGMPEAPETPIQPRNESAEKNFFYEDRDDEPVSMGEMPPEEGMDCGEMADAPAEIPMEMAVDIPVEITCVADGSKTLGELLAEQGVTMEEFLEKNDPAQLIPAAHVEFCVPKKI